MSGLRKRAISAQRFEPDPPTPGARIVRIPGGRRAQVVDRFVQTKGHYAAGLVLLFCEPLEGIDRHPRWLPESSLYDIDEEEATP